MLLGDVFLISMTHMNSTQTVFSLNCIIGVSHFRGGKMINDQLVKCGVCNKTKKVASERGAIKKIKYFNISECCIGLLNSNIF